MFRSLVRLVVALCLAPLAGCSLGNFIANESTDYNNTVEAATNDMLVTNILRARDNAPLFFSDLSQIRGSIQFNLAAQASFPWGPQFRPLTGTGVRRSEQIGPIALQNAPTFDIAPQNTKQFYEGIMEPLSPRILAYYLQSGDLSWVVMNIFVSRIEEVEVRGDVISVLNTYHYDDSQFLNLIYNWTYRFDSATQQNVESRPRVILSDGEPKPFGPKVAVDAKALVEASSANLEPKTIDGKFVQFSKKSPNVTICVKDIGGKYVAVGFVPNSVVKTPEMFPLPKSDEVCNPGAVGATEKKLAKDNVPIKRYRLRIRSVEEIFNYLGYLISDDYKDLAKNGKFLLDHKIDQSLIPFHIDQKPSGKVRFSTEYRGQVYYVNEYHDPNEYTITILAILNDLLNLNRDANPTPTTKAVQAVGG